MSLTYPRNYALQRLVLFRFEEAVAPLVFDSHRGVVGVLINASAPAFLADVHFDENAPVGDLVP